MWCRGRSWWLWRQVDAGTFAYSSMSVIHVASNKTHVSLGVVYEGTDRAHNVIGGLLWAVVTDFLPQATVAGDE